MKFASILAHSSPQTTPAQETSPRDYSMQTFSEWTPASKQNDTKWSVPTMELAFSWFREGGNLMQETDIELSTAGMRWEMKLHVQIQPAI